MMAQKPPNPVRSLQLVPRRRQATARCAEAIRWITSITIALVVLVITLPVITILAVAIRVESPGNPFFAQERVGRGGRKFNIYKLRGMYVDARAHWPELYSYSYSAEEAEKLTFHIRRDPRVTRVGRFIRSTSFDELPNLINVLKGDMLLVGPRPEIPELLPYYGDAAAEILSVPPGVTSVAKAFGRDDLDLGETLRLELQYVRARSLRLDARVLAATVPAVLGRKGIADR